MVEEDKAPQKEVFQAHKAVVRLVVQYEPGRRQYRNVPLVVLSSRSRAFHADIVSLALKMSFVVCFEWNYDCVKSCICTGGT